MKQGARLGLLLTLTLLLAASLAHAHHTPTTEAPIPQPTDDQTINDIQDAYAYSTQRTDTTLAPLISATAHHGWAPTLLQTYHQAHEQAQQRLTTITQHDLDQALLQLTHHAHPQAPLTTHDLRTHDIPPPYLPPIATLLEDQLSPPPAPTTPTDDAWTNTKNLATNAAHTLGTIDAILPHLHHAQDTTPIDEILPLDPYGLIILGSHNDDTYNPHTIADQNDVTLTWQGPLLMIEPGGNDTYNVPIAARSLIDTGIVPRLFASFPTLALDLAGNDTYNHLTATAEHGKNIKILISEDGDDHYGTLNRGRNIAHADSGFAYLLSKNGNDTFQVKDQGLASAQSEIHRNSAPAIAILANYKGNNTYQATIDWGLRTHAFAENAGAIAHLRDYQGNDTYQTRALAYARSTEDGHSLFWDDEGNDDYHIHRVGISFGYRGPNAGGLTNAPLDRALAYFLDANGTDNYEWDHLGQPDPHQPGNNTHTIDTRPDHRYGIFTDCQTPTNATYPCPEQQEETLHTILQTETQPLRDATPNPT